MGVGVGEFVDRVRGLYAGRIESAAAEVGERQGVRVLSEVALRGADGSAVREGVLGLPVRLDLVVVSSDDSTESVSVESGGILQFNPLRFVWPNGLKVAMHPFQWECLVIKLVGPVDVVDWEPLAQWFLRWFREDDDGDGRSALGVVHFLSDPLTVDGATTLTADLGSSPVEAFEDLLDAIAALGVSGVVLTRP
jgi:hypothetical protein